MPAGTRVLRAGSRGVALGVAVLATASAATASPAWAAAGRSAVPFSATPSVIATSDPDIFAGPVAIASGDFNADGKLDLVATDGATGIVDLLINQGGGTFSAPQPISLVGLGPTSIAVGALGGVGPGPDIAIAVGQASAPGNVEILRPDPASGPLAYADTEIPIDGIPDSIAIGDLTGHGKHDIAVTVATVFGQPTANKLELFLAKRQGRGYTEVTLPLDGTDIGSGPSSVAIGDLSGNGSHDIAVANQQGNIQLFLKHKKDSGYTVKTLADGGHFAGSIAIGNLGGVGKGSDIAVKSDAGLGSETVFLRDRKSPTGYAAQQLPTGITGGLTAERSLLIVPGLTKLACAEGAGLVTTNQQDNTLSVSVRSRSGAFVSSTVPTFTGALGGTGLPVDGRGPISLAAGDFTGDGLPDLAVVGQFSKTVSLLTNTTPHC